MSRVKSQKAPVFTVLVTVSRVKTPGRVGIEAGRLGRAGSVSSPRRQRPLDAHRVSVPPRFNDLTF